MGAVFISYRRADSAAMSGRIFDRLSHHFGDETVFIDIDNIPLGEDYRTHVSNMLDRCDLILAVVGPRWAGPREDGGFRIQEPTDLVRLELEAGLARNIPVIPLLVDDAAMPSATALPESLQPFAFRNAMEVDTGKDFRVHIERLIRDIEQKLAARATTKPRAARKPAAARPAKPATEPEPTPAQPAVQAEPVAKKAAPVAPGRRAWTIAKLCGVLAVIAIVIVATRKWPDPAGTPPATPAATSPQVAAPAAPASPQPVVEQIPGLVTGEHALGQPEPDGTASWNVAAGWTVTTATLNGQPYCFAMGEPQPQQMPADERDWLPSVIIANRPADGVQGEVTIDPGVAIDLTQNASAVVGFQTFPLAIEGSSQRLLLLADPADERRLVAAMRTGALLDIAVVTEDGRDFLDRYDLTGVTQALDSIDQACPP